DRSVRGFRNWGRPQPVPRCGGAGAWSLGLTRWEAMPAAGGTSDKAPGALQPGSARRISGIFSAQMRCSYLFLRRPEAEVTAELTPKEGINGGLAPFASGVFPYNLNGDLRKLCERNRCSL